MNRYRNHIQAEAGLSVLTQAVPLLDGLALNGD